MYSSQAQLVFMFNLWERTNYDKLFSYKNKKLFAKKIIDSCLFLFLTLKSVISN